MTDLESSLTAMDWLPRLSVGGALSTGRMQSNLETKEETNMRMGFANFGRYDFDPENQVVENTPQRDAKPTYSYANLITFAVNRFIQTF